MRELSIAVVAMLLAALPPTAQAQGKIPVSFAGPEVSGEIRLVEGKAGKPASDAADAVVWLVPLDAAEPVRIDASSRTYRMVQQRKQFHPHLLVVPLDSVVVFPNLDPWFHNVFSLYRGKRFDLGLYEAGTQKAVRFDRPGPSYIFCNIHPEMMAVVLVVDTPFYAISAKSGRWSIPRVPPGRYKLRVWHEDAAPAALKALARVVEVGTSGAVLAGISIPVSPHEWLNHTNLYGRKYDSKGLTAVY